MDAGIIAALISGGVTLAVCLINNNTHFNKIQAENKATMAVFNEKITQLKEEVEKHNGVVEKTFKLEGDHKDYNRHFEAVDRRLKNLEHYHAGE